MRNIFKSMMRWPICFFLLTLVGCGSYFAFDFFLKRGWIGVALTAAIAAVLTLLWFITVKTGIEESVVTVGLEVNGTLQDKMEGLANPYALINEDGKILWKNEAFRQVLEEYGPEEVRNAGWLGEIFPDNDIWERAAAGPEEETDGGADGEEEPVTARHYLTLGDRVFAVDLKRLEGEMPLAAFMLSDETEHLQTLVELQDEKNVSGLVYVDNFEELLKSTETEKQSLLGAIIEQRITRYFQAHNGLVCRTERDRFFVSIDAKGLRECIEDKFSLLNDVKNIKLGNTTAVTLSCAFGHEGETYEANMDLARAAMDLALARGGDQAIVKTPEDVEYFGGKALGEAALTRVKTRVKAQALYDLMSGKEQVFIMGHNRCDNDSFGAAVAVYRMAVSLRKETHIILNGVSASVRPLWEKFLTDPDYPREMFLTSEEATDRMGENPLVVVVDTNRAQICECPELLEMTDQIVVFDHHRQASDAIPAILAYVEPYASSACEMVAEIMQYFGENLKPNPLEAETIYSGIVVDTNNFSDRTGARTFEAAAYLRRNGADLVSVKKSLRENYDEFRVKADTVRRAEIFMDGYAFAECCAEELDSPTIVGAKAANDLLNIAGIRASFVFTRLEDTVYVSARSIDEVNVQLICERMGGGGHLSVAGVQFNGLSVGDAMTKVKATIKTMTEEGVIE